MGFNSGFKGLKFLGLATDQHCVVTVVAHLNFILMLLYLRLLLFYWTFCT